LLNRRTLLASGLALALAGLTACNSTVSRPPLPVVGAGSMFVFPVMQRWTSDFSQIHTNVAMSYESTGDAAGASLLESGKAAFAAVDVPLPAAELAAKNLLELPETAGPVCIIYHLPGVRQTLRLSGKTLADIFGGKITKWNDPAIQNENPGVNLPDHAIAVFHRTDGSGSTSLLTQYLAASSPAWQKIAAMGAAAAWPAGVGSEGSQDMAAEVRDSPYSLGYVELTYAQENYLPTAALQNAAGHFIAPTGASATAALHAFESKLTENASTAVVNPPATWAAAYPIVGLNYLIVPRDGTNPARQQALRQFAEFVIHNGQDTAAELHYARLTPALLHYDEQQLAAMAAGGHLLKKK
jgi:phosphate transport system substrate-binding protein